LRLISHQNMGEWRALCASSLITLGEWRALCASSLFTSFGRMEGSLRLIPLFSYTRVVYSPACLPLSLFVGGYSPACLPLSLCVPWGIAQHASLPVCVPWCIAQYASLGGCIPWCIAQYASLGRCIPPCICLPIPRWVYTSLYMPPYTTRVGSLPVYHGYVLPGP